MAMSEGRDILIDIYKSLDEHDQHALLRYAQFLQHRSAQTVVNTASQNPLPEPVFVEAAENETVVGAIKRLSATYPMLNKSKMLDKTSVLMSEHMMQGRDKAEVIQELESVFAAQYQLFLRQQSS